MSKQSSSGLIWLSLCAIMACGPLSPQAQACDVPVFRYALERWPVDPYRAVAVETKPFTKAEEKMLGELHRQARSEDLNLQLQTMSAAAFSKSTYGRHLAEPVTQNALLLFYPVTAGLSQPVWRGGISVETIKALSACESRRQLVKDLLGGSSAVFLLLESGDPKKDGEARLLLDARRKELNQEIALPSQVVAADQNQEAGDPINQLQSAIPFKVDFGLLAIPRPAQGKDPAKILRQCLLGLEADLKELQEEPMAFLVYGRGRVMPALVGKGINARMIDQLAFFVTGACSCQVKRQNPGTDLLIRQNWDKAVLGEAK